MKACGGPKTALFIRKAHVLSPPLFLHGCYRRSRSPQNYFRFDAPRAGVPRPGSAAVLAAASTIATIPCRIGSGSISQRLITSAKVGVWRTKSAKRDAKWSSSSFVIDGGIRGCVESPSVFKTSGGFEQSSQWVRFPYTPVPLMPDRKRASLQLRSCSRRGMQHTERNSCEFRYDYDGGFRNRL